MQMQSERSNIEHMPLNSTDLSVPIMLPSLTAQYMGGGFVVAAASTLLQDAELDFASTSADSTEEASTSSSAEEQQQQQPQRTGGSKWVIDENEQLQSTWEHSAWTGGR